MAGNDGFTKLLLHCDGSNGATTFADNSFGGGGHVMTANGNAQVDTAQRVFGSGSAKFDGTGDYLSGDGSNDFVFGPAYSGDWTIDFWVKHASVTGNQEHVWLGTALAPLIYIKDGGQLIYANGVDRILGDTLVINTWYHIAALRLNGVTRMFINGVQTGSDYIDLINYVEVDATAPRIGADNTTEFLNGWIDEVRLSKGTDRGWFGGFAPPTQAYDVTANVIRGLCLPGFRYI